jgi:hypothetical protein
LPRDNSWQFILPAPLSKFPAEAPPGFRQPPRLETVITSLFTIVPYHLPQGMPKLRDVEFWLENDANEEYPMYGMTVERENTVKFYIISEHGESFSINWKLPKGLRSVYDLYCDDISIAAPAIEKSCVTHRRCVGLQKSHGAYSPFQFSVNVVECML